MATYKQTAEHFLSEAASWERHAEHEKLAQIGIGYALLAIADAIRGRPDER